MTGTPIESSTADLDGQFGADPTFAQLELDVGSGSSTGSSGDRPRSDTSAGLGHGQITSCARCSGEAFQMSSMELLLVESMGLLSSRCGCSIVA